MKTLKSARISSQLCPIDFSAEVIRVAHALLFI